MSRADQDALAAESHRRAAAARDAGYFAEQITPVEVPGREGTVTFDTDEHIRDRVTEDDLTRLRPAFTGEGTVTAGDGRHARARAAAGADESERQRSLDGPSDRGDRDDPHDQGAL